MAKQEIITPEHIQQFEEYLRVVERVLPIEWTEVQKALNSCGGQWPPPGKITMMLIVSTEIRNRCMPFQPMAALTTPPRHVSKETGILEFKLLDANHSNIRTPKGPVYFPASVSVFPSGRKILKVFSLTLDTEQQGAHYDRHTMRVGRKLFRNRPLVVDLVRHLITSFPIDENDVRSQETRRHALSDLEAGDFPEPSDN